MLRPQATLGNLDVNLLSDGAKGKTWLSTMELRGKGEGKQGISKDARLIEKPKCPKFQVGNICPPWNVVPEVRRPRGNCNLDHHGTLM